MEVKEVAKQAAKETFKFYKTRKFWISFILWMVCLTAFNHYAPHKYVVILDYILLGVIALEVLSCVVFLVWSRAIDKRCTRMDKAIGAMEEANKIIATGDLSRIDEAVKLVDEFCIVANELAKRRKINVRKKADVNAIRAEMIENFNRNNGTID